MKKIFALFLVLCSVLYSNGQKIYYDVLYMREQDPDDTLIVLNKDIRQILMQYYPGKKEDDIDSALLNLNPFFKGHFVPRAIQADNTKFNPFRASSIGGLNVTNFADGLAKFLVKRFKEELSVTFFENFKDDINKNYEELRILFPQTHRVFLVIDKEIYNFSKYLNSLREAFIKDLGNLYVGLKKLKDLPKYRAFLDSHPEINTIVVNAFYFIDQYTNGIHPGDVIARYKEDEYLNFSDADLQTNIRSSVKVLKLVSNSFKSISVDRYWVTADSVKLMFTDALSRDLYFGLIYQKGTGIDFKTSAGLLTFQELLKKAKGIESILIEYQRYVESIIEHAQEVNEYIIAIKEKIKSEVDYNDYYKLFNASLDILDEGLLLVDLPALEIDPGLKEKIKVKISAWTGLGRTAGELYVDIRTKNYSSAILNLVAIIDVAFESSFDNQLRKKILKYGSFVAAIAAAENSDEVEQVIEAVVLPVGSSRIKRESQKNISLNAYVGGFAGGEYMPVLKEKERSFVFGLSAPVGVAFSVGNLRKGSNGEHGGKSISLFISLIDIGALATFRLNDDQSKVASEIELKNIVAPGAYFYYGFGKCPISLGAGVQLGPQLREVTTTNINVEKNYYLRYGITLAVDIPLLNFYTKSSN
jgi:hypothetical protein